MAEFIEEVVFNDLRVGDFQGNMDAMNRVVGAIHIGARAASEALFDTVFAQLLPRTKFFACCHRILPVFRVALRHEVII